MLLEGRPLTCAEIEVYTASKEVLQKHVLITIGALRRSCGWSAHDADRRMEAEDLVCEALLTLRKTCERTCIDDLYRYMSTILRNEVVRFCQRASRRVSFDDHIPGPSSGHATIPTTDALDAVISAARTRISNERDQRLFDMYVEGEPNRAMRAVDPRSDRQITRLRTSFAELLRQCYAEVTA